MMPPLLPRMNITNMQLNKRYSNTKQRISDRDARVRKPAWIDNYAVCAIGTRCLDAIDYGAFPVTTVQ